MKLLKKIFLFAFAAAILTGCEDDDDKFTGSPIDTMNFVTLQGQISTTAQSALSNQRIDFTVTLPRTFSDTVAVEATAISKTGRRIRKSVDVLPGDLSATEEIVAPGGSIFNTTFDLYISGIALQTVDQGIHYLIESNVLEIPTGSSGVPVQDPAGLLIRLVWENPVSNTVNSLQGILTRPNGVDQLLNYGGGFRQHRINTAQTGTDAGPAVSTSPGDYTFSVRATGFSENKDVPYRVIVVRPNGDTEVFAGVYNATTGTNPIVPVLKVNKSYDLANIAVFTTENLLP